MLMLENLNARESSWESFSHVIRSNKFNFIIYDGNNNCQDKSLITLTHEQCVKYETRFKSVDLAVAGISHGNVIGPLFALTLQSDLSSVRLVDYATFFSNNTGEISTRTIEMDLTNLVAYMSHFYKNISHITLPAIIPSFKNDDCEFKLDSFGNGVLAILKG